MANHMVTPTQRRAYSFAAAMGWEIDTDQVRVAFFVPERDARLAFSLDELIPGWHAERLDDGRLVVWTFWLGSLGDERTGLRKRKGKVSA